MNGTRRRRALERGFAPRIVGKPVFCERSPFLKKGASLALSPPKTFDIISPDYQGDTVENRGSKGATPPWPPEAAYKTTFCRAWLALLLLCLGLACAHREPEWSRPGAPPLALEGDKADCRASAEAMARAESFSGRRPLPDVARRIYLGCMASRGWSAATEDGPPAGCPGTPHLDGLAVEPPHGFAPGGRDWLNLGAVTGCTYIFHGPDGALLRLEVQAAQGGYLPVAAPVEPSLVLVDRGQEARGETRLDWAVAAGERNGVAVAAFTAFVLAAGGKERLFVGLAVPLADGEPVPPGLRLSHARREAALGLARAWREWLARVLARR